MSQAEIKYVSDETGQTVEVIVPIQLWREIESERETAYLLQSETMKSRLVEAKNRQEEKDTVTKPKRKPALAGTEPFIFYGTPEESGIPADEWDMEKE